MPRSLASLSGLSLAAFLLALSLPVAAQWAWRDENGRLVYSDQAPPKSVKPTQIVRQPPGGALSAPALPSAAAAPEGKPETSRSAGPKSVAEQEAEFRKRQKERAEADAKAQRDNALMAQQAADCERNRGYLRTLEDGNRLFQTNAQGEREAIDDARRESEIRRVREALIKNCA